MDASDSCLGLRSAYLNLQGLFNLASDFPVVLPRLASKAVMTVWKVVRTVQYVAEAHSGKITACAVDIRDHHRPGMSKYQLKLSS